MTVKIVTSLYFLSCFRNLEVIVIFHTMWVTYYKIFHQAEPLTSPSGPQTKFCHTRKDEAKAVYALIHSK